MLDVVLLNELNLAFQIAIIAIFTAGILLKLSGRPFSTAS